MCKPVMLGLPFFVTSMLLLPLAFISLASPSETEPKLGTDTPHPFGDPSLYEHTLSLPPAIPNREFDISPPEQPAANHDPSVVAHLLGGSPRPIDTHTPVNHPGLSVEPTVKDSDPGPHPCHPEFVPTASVRYVPTVPPRLSIHTCVETKWAVAWGRLRLDGRMGNLCITIEDNKPVGISLELLVETYQEILHRCWRRVPVCPCDMGFQKSPARKAYIFVRATYIVCTGKDDAAAFRRGPSCVRLFERKRVGGSNPPPPSYQGYCYMLKDKNNDPRNQRPSYPELQSPHE